VPEIEGHFFKGVRRGWVRVEFTGGETLELRREVFADFGFGNGSVVDAEELDAAVRESDRRHGRSVALRFFRERPRSEQEIRLRLRREKLRPETIDSLVADFTTQGLLNDADFARAWVGSRTNLRPKGVFLIRRELREKGVDDDHIDAALAQDYPGELEVARPLAEARATALAGEDWARFRQKLGVYLKRRGFANDTIERLVDEGWEIHGGE
jgi:regulatory protein